MRINTFRKLLVGLLVALTLLSSQSLAWATEPAPVDSQESLQLAINNAPDGTATEIALPSDLTITKTINIPSNKNIILKAGTSTSNIKLDNKSNGWSAINIESGASLTYSDNIVADLNGACLVMSSGTFNMNGGTIKNGLANYAYRGILTFNGADAHFNMNGGEITGNKANNSNGIIQLNDGAYGKMDNGLVTDSKITTQFGAAIVVKESHFVMNGGTISKNDAGKERQSSGGVLVIALKSYATESLDSEFTMNGGTITENAAAYGGGVYVFGGSPAYADFKSTAHFTMNGGTISNNKANGYIDRYGVLAPGGGGGVYVQTAGNFVMNDGTISGNSSYGHGGGVATYDEFVSYFGKVQYDTVSLRYNDLQYKDWYKFYPASFLMKGGEIIGNNAYGDNGNDDKGCGGGVYCGSANNTIEAGTIMNNTSSRQGGGLYVGSVPYVLNIDDAVITSNNAEVIGGGAWFCPTGSADFSVNNGSAIYGNTANEAGDDVAVVRTLTSEATVSLSDKMLGGGKANWYQDGAIASGALGTGDPSVARFTAGSSTNTKVSEIDNSDDKFALKAQPTSADLAKIGTKAKVTISNNSSLRGGGIGSNGQVNFGSNYDYPDEEPSVTEPPTDSPKEKVAAINTSDSANLFLLIGILLLSASGLIIISIHRRLN